MPEQETGYTRRSQGEDRQDPSSNLGGSIIFGEEDAETDEYHSRMRGKLLGFARGGRPRRAPHRQGRPDIGTLGKRMWMPQDECPGAFCLYNGVLAGLPCHFWVVAAVCGLMGQGWFNGQDGGRSPGHRSVHGSFQSRGRCGAIRRTFGGAVLGAENPGLVDGLSRVSRQAHCALESCPAPVRAPGGSRLWKPAGTYGFSARSPAF